MIVIIDDHKALATFLGVTLSRKGYNVKCLHTLEEAESYFAGTVAQVSTILLDLSVKGKQSVAFARFIKRQRPDISITMISGAPPKDFGAIKDLLDEKVISGFVEKPFTVDDISKHLKPLP